MSTSVSGVTSAEPVLQPEPLSSPVQSPIQMDPPSVKAGGDTYLPQLVEQTPVQMSPVQHDLGGPIQVGPPADQGGPSAAQQVPVQTVIQPAAPVQIIVPTPVQTPAASYPVSSTVVQKGETFGDVAQRVGCSTSDLAKKNKGCDPNMTFPGQHLKVPHRKRRKGGKGGDGAPGKGDAAPGKGSPSQVDPAALRGKISAKKWLTGDLKGLNPDLVDRLARLGRSLGKKLSITSGHRTHAEQEVLYKRYLAGEGNLAAKPGSSNHESGNAADVKVGGQNLADAPGAKEAAARLGLGFPVDGEAWHVELV